MGTDVEVLEVLLWGRIASQPHLSWLVHAVSASADKPAHICSGQVQKGWSLCRLEVSCPHFCTPEENGQV